MEVDNNPENPSPFLNSESIDRTLKEDVMRKTAVNVQSAAAAREQISKEVQKKQSVTYRFKLDSLLLFEFLEIRGRDYFGQPAAFKERRDEVILEPEKKWNSSDKEIAVGLFCSVLQRVPATTTFEPAHLFRFRPSKPPAAEGKKPVNSLLFTYAVLEPNKLEIIKLDQLEAKLSMNALTNVPNKPSDSAAHHVVTIGRSAQVFRYVESLLDDPHYNQFGKQFSEKYSTSMDAVKSLLDRNKSGLSEQQIYLLIGLFDCLIPVVATSPPPPPPPPQ